MAATGRHGSRRLLVQALYQYQLSGYSTAEIAAQFAVQRDFRLVDVDYFRLLLGEILGDTDALDSLLTGQADRPVAQLDPVERGILWLGLAELKLHREVPVKVVINEAVELAKRFGTAESSAFVNGVLDRIASAVGRSPDA